MEHRCIKYNRIIKRTNTRAKINAGVKRPYQCPERREGPCSLDCTLFKNITPDEIRPLAKAYSPDEEAADFAEEYRASQRKMSKALNEYEQANDTRPSEKGRMPPCYSCYPENILFCANHSFECDKFHKYVTAGYRI